MRVVQKTNCPKKSRVDGRRNIIDHTARQKRALVSSLGLLLLGGITALWLFVR